MQLSIIRKDSTPSGQEELRTETVTVTVKEGAEEPVATKPGVGLHAMCHRGWGFWKRLPDTTNLRLSLHRREAADSKAAATACHGPAEARGKGTQGRAESSRQ